MQLLNGTTMKLQCQNQDIVGSIINGFAEGYFGIQLIPKQSVEYYFLFESICYR
jgi:hypothetical protein